MRAFFATNHLHDFVQPHLANIDIVGRALRHSGNSVAHFQPSIRLGGPARNEALDLGVAVFGAEHGADSHEREAHVNAEILQVGLAQVLGVRVVGLGERVEEELDLFVSVFLVDVAGEAIVTPRHQLRAGLDRVFT